MNVGLERTSERRGEEKEGSSKEEKVGEWRERRGCIFV